MKTVSILALCSVAACTTLDKPFLYEASKEDRKITVFGTIHMGVPGWDLPPEVIDAVKSSDTAYFETDPLAAKGPVRSSLFADGPKVKDHFTDAEIQRLAALNSKVTPVVVASLEPSVALAVVSMEEVQMTTYEARALDLKNGLDFTLMKKVRELGIPYDTLDSDEYGLCKSEIEDEAVGALREILSGRPVTSAYDVMDALIDAYRGGDEVAISSFNEKPQFSCVLDERNHRWAALLEKNVKAGEKTFVAVGVAHLLDTKAGPGLLNLLAKQGYSIKRKMPSGE